MHESQTAHRKCVLFVCRARGKLSQQKSLKCQTGRRVGKNTCLKGNLEPCDHCAPPRAKDDGEKEKRTWNKKRIRENGAAPLPPNPVVFTL